MRGKVRNRATAVTQWPAADQSGQPIRAQIQQIIDETPGGAGTGDVVGPASAVTNHVVSFDGTTGKLVKDSGVLVADVVVTTDTRLSDARTPTAHTHAEADVTGLVADLAATEKTANKNAASGYAGLDASSKLTGSQQKYGSAANTAAEGNDTRLSDARTPTAHTHPESDVTNLVTDLAGKAGALGLSTITSTGNQTALAIPTGTGDLFSYLNNATLLTVQGMAAGLDGQRWTLISVGAGRVDFKDQDGAATAARRLINRATSGPTSLAAGKGRATYVYDADTRNAGANPRWKLISHEQGDWITVPYTSTDFTSDAGTWTVDSGDLLGFRYVLEDRKLTVAVVITNSSTTGTPLGLFVLIPSGFTISAVVNAISFVIPDGITAGPGIVQINNGVSTTKIRLLKIDITTWATVTNLLSASFTLVFPVD